MLEQGALDDYSWSDYECQSKYNNNINFGDPVGAVSD